MVQQARKGIKLAGTKPLMVGLVVMVMVVLEGARSQAWGRLPC